ncbi:MULTISPECIES: mannose-1-phosphate guanylyltransferase [Halolamina]|uniref:Mannose-1-phosphate guanylyltransferase n=1 Tax=Halolamina pelagica TaxID=699431 RepID=A0A1I5S9U2_9EURY|nr:MULTISPECIES: sugar phosphate nucleotidyltransferase [Halolamina]NHX37158.1 mannose-1-phosphate guanylyltransferase [Halolamina sp. R1-12]SFP67490.1 mannose-1-phosphate guanylyltransferase [Halolamina pelagica]
MHVVALVLAGGIGSRLYPASRSDRPKQFLPISGDRSLLSQTVERAGFADETIVATRPRFADEIGDHAPDADVLVEPDGKDTGPALTYATHRIREEYGDADEQLVIVALPSDHRVDDDAAFQGTMTAGARVAAETGRLVTFGVTPDRPETGYGYVEPGAARETGGVGFHEVAKFHEKPDAETARAYVDAGYRWNSGMFAWTPASFLDAAADSPLVPLVDALAAGDPDAGFEAVEPVSVDYAVFEGAENVAVVDADFAWDDLGSWDALDRVLAPDDDGNVALGEYTAVDAADNVVASDDKHVSLVGVSGLAVVVYDDRVLVVPKEDAQRVRELVSVLADRGAF